MNRSLASFTRVHKTVVVSLWPAMVLFLCCGNSFAGDAVELAGDVLQFALPVGAGGVTLGLKDWPGSLQLVESEGLTLAATYALKYGLDTRRPNGGSHSFPSGHASVSFSAAEFLRKRYGWEAGIPAYAAASFVAYSRVESGQHYDYDVIGGAAIGILSSFIFTKPYHGWEFKGDSSTGLKGLFVSRCW
jgi:membrane-associated phospholipid phosphatase